MKASLKGKAAVAGAVASGLAGAGSAATVQISLMGNMVSSLGGDELKADVTGDGTDDFVINFVAASNLSSIGARINNSPVYAARQTFSNPAGSYFVYAAFAGGGVGTPGALNQPSPQNVTYLNEFSFTDARINGGAQTEGYLEINAFNTGLMDHTVQITRLVFDDESTTRPDAMNVSTTQQYTEFVPEPSSLALLALGAGGLTVRRRRERAAA